MANYENITLEKGMYSVKGKSMTDVLEELDPSENYAGTSLAGLDAFSRQLKRFDIKVSGKGSDCVEKFFQSSGSAALFPEYVSQAVRAGMESVDILPNIVATVTNIDGMDYRTITSTPEEDDKTLKIVGEGAYIPQTTVKTQENLVKLHKRGRMLVASYEAVRFQRLDLFTVTLKQIGAYIARAQLKDAVDVLLNGDGNNNPCSVISAEAVGKLSYNDLVSLWAGVSPYELNTILAPTDAMKKLLALDEMKDASAGLNFQGTGKMVTPMGATLLHAQSMESGKIIGLDKNCALEMVQAGDIVTDYDKLIDRQLERASISCIAGFAKIFKDSAKALEY
ncbi:MAG: phage major capsid protein [Acutalibacteraceae bacterium]